MLSLKRMVSIAIGHHNVTEGLHCSACYQSLSHPFQEKHHQICFHVPHNFQFPQISGPTFFGREMYHDVKVRCVHHSLEGDCNLLSVTFAVPSKHQSKEVKW